MRAGARAHKHMHVHTHTYEVKKVELNDVFVFANSCFHVVVMLRSSVPSLVHSCVVVGACLVF